MEFSSRVITGTSGPEERLDPTFKVYSKGKYQVGLVFKILWSEPGGSSTYYSSSTGIPHSRSSISSSSKYGETAYHTIRRFIVMEKLHDHCLCLPILTYGGQGTLKRGVHSEDHAIIYTGQVPPPLLRGEQVAPNLASIRIRPSRSRHMLDPASRINYAKIYTVEYNVKIQSIGQMDENHMERFLENLRIAHPSWLANSTAHTLASSVLRGWNDGSTFAPSTADESIFSSLGKASSKSSIPGTAPSEEFDRFTRLLRHEVIFPMKTYLALSTISREVFERKFRRLLRQTSKFLFKIAKSHSESQVAEFVGLRARNAAYVVCESADAFDVNGKEERNSSTHFQQIDVDQDDISYVSDDTNASDLEGPEGDTTAFPSENFGNMEHFLESSGSIEWLRVSIKILLHPAGVFAQVVQHLLENLWPTSDVLVAYPISYTICWELPQILRHFYPHGISLRGLMTITGNGVNAQAIACGEYLRTTWPEIAEQLLDVIDKLLESCHKGTSKTDDAEVTMEMLLPPEDLMAIPDESFDMRSYQTQTRVSVMASYELQVHIGSALSWLTSAIRYSDDGGLCLSKPSLRVVRRSEQSSFIRIESLPLIPVYQPSCWHALFTNSVIAHGFPIRIRQEGVGLEIPIADAFHLAGSLKLIDHDDGLLAKGLCCILVPTEEHQSDEAIQWHLIQDPTGPLCGQISSTTSLLKYITTQGWHKTNDPGVLTQRRAFVGWAGQAEVVIGTPCDSRLVSPSGARECKFGKQRITGWSLTTSSSGLGILGAGANISFAASKICTRFVQQRQKKIAYRLQDAKSSHATIYDYTNETAWCIPESSLVLCIAHNIIARRKLRTFRDGQETLLGRAEPCADGGNAAWAVLKDSLKLEIKFENNDECLETFSQMLETIFLNLHIVTEKLVEFMNNPEKGDRKAPSWLVGYELDDVVMDAKIFMLKEKEVKKPWTKICQDAGVVLFTGAIDDAITAHVECPLCDAWRRPPPGRELFVATASAVINFVDRHGTENGSYLSEKVDWDLATPLIQQHEHHANGSSTCFHWQSLSTVENAKRQSSLRQLLEAHKDGAFIFDKKALRKPCVATLAQTPSAVQASASLALVSANNTINPPSTSRTLPIRSASVAIRSSG